MNNAEFVDISREMTRDLVRKGANFCVSGSDTENIFHPKVNKIHIA